MPTTLDVRLRSLVVEQVRALREAGIEAGIAPPETKQPPPKPQDMARRIMSSRAIDYAYGAVGADARPDDIVSAAVQYVLDTNIDSQQRKRLGAGYMARLTLALKDAANGFM